MLVTEIEPQALVARRVADHRQHVGQARAAAEPGLGVEPLAYRIEVARERLQSIDMRGGGRVVDAREFRAGGQPQSARHWRDDVASLEIENRARKSGIAPR